MNKLDNILLEFSKVVEQPGNPCAEDKICSVDMKDEDINCKFLSVCKVIRKLNEFRDEFNDYVNEIDKLKEFIIDICCNGCQMKADDICPHCEVDVLINQRKIT